MSMLGHLVGGAVSADAINDPSTEAPNRNNEVEQRPHPAADEDEEEDDFNPEAEVGSDGEAEDNAPVKNVEPPAQKSRSQSEARRSKSATASRRQSEDQGSDVGSDRLRSQERRTSGAAVDDVNGGSSPQDDQDGDGEGDEEENVADGENDDEDGNDDAENDDEEDEDEEEEEDEQIQGPSKKRRKRNRNQFIDVEAEVDEEDEEEDEEDEPEGFVADDHPDDDALAPGQITDDRGHKELDRQRQAAEQLSAEQIAAQVNERHRDYGKSRGVAADSAILPQRLLLPSVEDPTIWGVRCKPGKEREIVFAITKRIEQRLDANPLKITCAFERGGSMAGFVYVEARTKAHVKEAVDGISSVFLGKDMVLVPIQEMPDLLKTKKSKTIEPGMWVRIKRGKYQGDLAYVEDVYENGLEVVLKIVPREDYGLNEDTNAPLAPGSMNGAAAKRKRTIGFGKNILATRPPPRLFSEMEAKKKHSRFLQQLDSLSTKKFQYSGNTYMDGFLIKNFRVNLVSTDDVNPTLEEVSKFTTGEGEGADTLDLQKLASTLKTTSSDSYLPGDAVEIYSGEQRGVTGKAVSVRGDIVTIKVTVGTMAGESIDAPVKDLRKRFREGDHVKVIGGSKYLDEVGLVVKIKDDRVTLVSDSNNEQITVFSKDLRAATDAGSSRLGSKYDLHDLVSLDQSTVGIVTKVDRESLRVLDQNNSSRTLLPSSISGKLERRRNAVATDKDGVEIRNDDTVKETGGDQRSGRILHIHRAFLFIHSRNQAENSGVFVLRSSQVITVAAHGTRGTQAGPDLTKMNPTTQIPGVNNQNGIMGPPKPMGGRDRMIGKTCTIRKGAHKGLMGIIKDTTDSHARIELHTKSKVVNVAKTDLTLKDPLTGNTIDVSRFGGPPRSQFDNPAVPSNRYAGAATPAWNTEQGPWGGNTSYGGAGGGRTPAPGNWAMANSNTWGGGTAYGGGGRTPAQPMNGGQTALWTGNDGSRTAFVQGGRTPHWTMDGGRTPAPAPRDDGYVG